VVVIAGSQLGSALPASCVKLTWLEGVSRCCLGDYWCYFKELCEHQTFLNCVFVSSVLRNWFQVGVELHQLERWVYDVVHAVEAEW